MYKLLSELVFEQCVRPDLSLVAFGKNKDRYSWLDFNQRIDSYQNELESIVNNSGVVAISESDGFNFLAMLFAAWRCGKQVIIAANTLALTQKTLISYQPYFWGDWPNTIDQPCLDATTQTLSAPLTLLTSGSSGNPTAIPKTFAQIDAEVQMFEKVWGEEFTDVVLGGSVSHQHMYGLLFRLLWPLCTERPFISAELEYWENIEDWASRERLVLITSPPHLQNIGVVSPKVGLQHVFSAGAPLPLAAGQACEKEYRTNVTQIYGSTETGAVAFRSLQSEYWQALPSVSFGRTKEGFLSISSDTVAEASFESKDLCRLSSDQQFELLGRADSIVKIAGKRVSIGALEQFIMGHAFVESARLVVLESRNSRVGAVVTLSRVGKAALIDRGRKSINQELSSCLDGKVERVALPRYWRYVSSMPVDKQGKTVKAALAGLFSEIERPKFGDIINVDKIDTDEREIKIHMDPNILYFEGHFEGSPVLPGVVQISWAAHYGHLHFGVNTNTKVLESLKFQSVIFPHDLVVLNLKLDRNKNKLYFEYSSARGKHSSGRLVLEY